MAKYLLIAAIVFSVATAVLGYMNHTTLVETKATLEQTTTKLNVTTTNLNDTTKKLKDTTATLDATEKEKTDLATELGTTKTDLASTKTQLDTATKESTDKDATIADLQKQVDDFKRIAGAGKEGQTSQQVLDDFKRQIDELNAQVASLKEQLGTSKSLVADLQAKEKARQDHVMQKGLEGRVLAVNPAWNFVVISIGDKQGVSSNAEMLLKRGDQFLGKVRVTSVEPSTSIADILVNTLPAGVAVQPGDSVIFQGSE